MTPLYENSFYTVTINAKINGYEVTNKVTGVIESNETKFPTAVGMAKGLEAATKRLMNDNKDTGVCE